MYVRPRPGFSKVKTSLVKETLKFQTYCLLNVPFLPQKCESANAPNNFLTKYINAIDFVGTIRLIKQYVKLFKDSQNVVLVRFDFYYLFI